MDSAAILGVWPEETFSLGMKGGTNVDDFERVKGSVETLYQLAYQLELENGNKLL